MNQKILVCIILSLSITILGVIYLTNSESINLRKTHNSRLVGMFQRACNEACTSIKGYLCQSGSEAHCCESRQFCYRYKPFNEKTFCTRTITVTASAFGKSTTCETAREARLPENDSVWSPF